MRIIKIIGQLIVGMVFIFSGFVKTIDPLGSAYKFGDYFTAFGVGFLEPVTLPLSILLSAAETTIGIALLLSYRMRFFSWMVMLFMSFFTILTLVLAIFNPVTDCGCFGDALIITNWQTFWKNVVILVFVVIIFIRRDKYEVRSKKWMEWTVVLTVFLFFSSFGHYSYNHLPLVDFRPYSIGTNIPHNMNIPPDASRDVYETRLTYINKNTGNKEIFSLDNFPTDTTRYMFHDAESILISKGYEPPIHDFYISNLSGHDITDIIIHDPGFSFLLITHNLAKANKKALKSAEDYAKFAKVSENVRFYAITASSNAVIDSIKERMDISYEFYHADEITLKTIIRANPGLLLVKNGTILGKWHYNDFPSFGLTGNDFNNIISNYPFSPGTRISRSTSPPPGADTDVYETLLYYRNINNGSISEFTIDNFPSSPEWQFVDSDSRIIRKGYLTPLSGFNPVTPEGVDISSEIVSERGNVLILMVKDPGSVNNELLTRVNNLSVVAAGIDTATFRFYGITGLYEQDLLSFADKFISPVQFLRMNENYVDKIAGDGLTLIWIRNGWVMDITRDDKIPTPSDFEMYISKSPQHVDPEQMLISPYLTTCRMTKEKRFIYIFIMGVFTFGLFVRIFFEKNYS